MSALTQEQSVADRRVIGQIRDSETISDIKLPITKTMLKHTAIGTLRRVD